MTDQEIKPNPVPVPAIEADHWKERERRKGLAQLQVEGYWEKFCPKCGNDFFVDDSHYRCNCGYARCMACNLEQGLHVCVPLVVEILKADKGFRAMIMDVLKNELAYPVTPKP